MTRRWHRFRNPWDREYAMRGPLWRGVADAGFVRAWVGEGARVLELGCGDGKFLEGLRSRGYRAVGVDFAPHALARARERGPFPLALGDVRRLPFRDATVDAVAARYVLGSLAAADRVLAAREIERVVAQTGTAVVEEFSLQDFRCGQGREVEPATFERNRGLWTHYFEEAEGPALFPGLALVHVDEVASRQRTDQGLVDRHRWRWVLRRHGGASPNDSRRASGDGSS